MKNIFNIEEVSKIARLSLLELTEEELKNFTKQFSVIMDYFELLNKAEITEIKLDYDESNLFVFREDKVVKSSISPEKFSPYLEGLFFKVPRVIEQDK